jgi:hypothetical protein
MSGVYRVNTYFYYLSNDDSDVKHKDMRYNKHMLSKCVDERCVGSHNSAVLEVVLDENGNKTDEYMHIILTDVMTEYVVGLHNSRAKAGYKQVGCEHLSRRNVIIPSADVDGDYQPLHLCAVMVTFKKEKPGEGAPYTVDTDYYYSSRDKCCPKFRMQLSERVCSDSVTDSSMLFSTVVVNSSNVVVEEHMKVVNSQLELDKARADAKARAEENGDWVSDFVTVDGATTIDATNGNGEHVSLCLEKYNLIVERKS